MDGDGYGWDVVSNDQSYVNGSYGLSSASWTSNTGALYPDNWIVLSGIQLGGSISFQARGQDPNFPAEKFCVYVCADANAQQDRARDASLTLRNLTPNTPYSWNVIGICGSDESCPSSTNIFITLDDVMVFTTEGNWNNAATGM
jgi:Cleaved Adhesin Domain.